MKPVLLHQLRDRPLPFFPKLEDRDYVNSVCDKLIASLENGGKHDRQLAQKLKKCIRDRAQGKPGCKSAACPVCRHDFRCWLIAEGSRLVADFLSKAPPDAKLYRATVIPDLGTIKPGDLVKSVPLVETELRRLSAYLRNKGPIAQGVMLIGVDVSWNLDDREDIDPRWQVHFEIVFAGIDPERLRKALKQRYPRTKTIFRPVQIKQVKDLSDLPGVIGYGCKLQHHARSRYVDRNGQARTSKQGLKAKQTRELSRFLDRFGLDRPLLPIGARRQGLTLRLVVPTTDGRA